jgi:microcystin-dependent protein
VAAGDNGGEETHALTTPELANHTHNTVKFNASLAAGSSPITLPFTTTLDSLHTQSPTGDTGGASTGANGNGHNNMPPYRGVYFLRRTARRFYTTS